MNAELLRRRELAARAQLDIAYKYGVALNRVESLFGDGPISQMFDNAYADWMTARAARGDRFAISLGWTAQGWKAS